MTNIWYVHLIYYIDQTFALNLIQATDYSALAGGIVAKNLTHFTLCSSIYIGFFRNL